ncbi:MAG: hypothetical protein IPK26_02795 [Planctomycetes bacterium]|nr:hypothetical protein [Planctomycetota bacterium]
MLLLLGAAAAFWLLRTGMVRRGVFVLVVLFAAADLALLARHAFDLRGAWLHAPLLLMQGVAIAAAGWLVIALTRRRWSTVRSKRQHLFAAGMAHYLRDELPQAATVFSQLRRADPWDVPATIAFANVLAAQGRVRQALRLLGHGAALDVRAEYRDLIDQQRQRLRGAK